MKEKNLIQTIKSILKSEYIGDDCAYLKDLGITVSQDSLVEDVHFSLKYTNAYQLGWKSAMVNISDICASGAEPKYMTIALSIPDYIDENFIKEFYKGAKDACGNVKIVGGDITGSDKLYISVTAIGLTSNRKISSRKNAKIGYKIIVSGEHGNSAKGLEIFKANRQSSQAVRNKFLQAHLMPVAKIDFSRQISQSCKSDYAMTDTSDGLGDALMQIAQASKVRLKIDTSKIPHDKSVDIETVLFGGEDYDLVAVVPKDLYVNGAEEIGEVVEGECGIEIDGKFYDDIENKLYNHFERGNDAGKI